MKHSSVKIGMKVRINSPGDEYHGQTGTVVEILAADKSKGLLAGACVEIRKPGADVWVMMRSTALVLVR